MGNKAKPNRDLSFSKHSGKTLFQHNHGREIRSRSCDITAAFSRRRRSDDVDGEGDDDDNGNRRRSKKEKKKSKKSKNKKEAKLGSSSSSAAPIGIPKIKLWDTPASAHLASSASVSNRASDDEDESWSK